MLNKTHLIHKALSRLSLNIHLFLFQLERIYIKSSLGKSFDRVEVEAFSRGSIIVDYYVVFKELERTVRKKDP